jgi:hypothetical protein
MWGEISSSLRSLHCRPSFASRYGIVCIDPPWKNRSVKRGKKYNTDMSFDELMVMGSTLQPLLQSQCVCAVWVTNSDTVSQFVTDTFLPSLGFSHVQTWMWLKVLAGCVDVPIYDNLSAPNPHKLPHERVLIGYRGPRPYRHASARDNSRNHYEVCSNTMLGVMPNSRAANSAHGTCEKPCNNEDSVTDSEMFPFRCIVSSPIRHSWKPPLHNLISEALLQYGGEKLNIDSPEKVVVSLPLENNYSTMLKKCDENLELFARFDSQYALLLLGSNTDIIYIF